MDTIKKNKETLTDASKEVDLEINIEETEYMLLSHHQNAVRNQDMKIATGTVQIRVFGDDSNKSKFDSGGN
jgi:hypothetical protein